MAHWNLRIVLGWTTDTIVSRGRALVLKVVRGANNRALSATSRTRWWSSAWSLPCHVARHDRSVWQGLPTADRRGTATRANLWCRCRYGPIGAVRGVWIVRHREERTRRRRCILANGRHIRRRTTHRRGSSSFRPRAGAGAFRSKRVLVAPSCSPRRWGTDHCGVANQARRDL